MLKTILVPSDDSPLSDHAINAAVRFAWKTGTGLVGSSVAVSYPFSPLSAEIFSDTGSEPQKTRPSR